MDDWDPFADPAAVAEPSISPGTPKPAAAAGHTAVGSSASKAADEDGQDFAERMRIARAISEQADRERLAREVNKKAGAEERAAQEQAKEQALADINRRQSPHEPVQEARTDSQAGALPRPARGRAPPTPMQPSKETLSYNFGGQKRGQPSQALPSYESLLDSMEDESDEPQHLGSTSFPPASPGQQRREEGASSNSQQRRKEGASSSSPANIRKLDPEEEEKIRKLTEQVILTCPDVTTLDLTGMSVSPEEKLHNEILSQHPELLEHVKPVIPFNADKVAAAAAEAEAKEAAEKARNDRLKSRNEGRRARGVFSSAVASQKSRSTALSTAASTAASAPASTAASSAGTAGTAANNEVEAQAKAPSMVELLAKLDAESAASTKSGFASGSGPASQRKGRAARHKMPDFSDFDESLIGPARPAARVGGKQSPAGAPAQKAGEAGDLDRLLEQATQRGDRKEMQRIFRQRMARDAQAVAATGGPSTLGAEQPIVMPQRLQPSAPARPAPLHSTPLYGQQASAAEASSSQEPDDVLDLEEILAQVDREEQAGLEAQSTRENFLALGDIGGCEDDFKPEGTQAALAEAPQAAPSHGRETPSPTPYFSKGSASGSTQNPEENATQGPRRKLNSRRLVIDRPTGAPGSMQRRLNDTFSISPEVREALDAGLFDGERSSATR